MTEVRADKWLWAARFYKTRALAAKACELGRVTWREQPVKPARPVRPGDTLRIRTEGGDFEVEVLALSDQRGPAPVAQTLYHETDESRERRRRAAEVRRLQPAFEPAPETRPTKRDRRELKRLRWEP
ncbi:MAG: RNA-binding S4 domain-containing protein [Acidobacteria bacterium]|nr:RNA-binding S4 domain-containing protein [Acidobacteriota bacterium]